MTGSTIIAEKYPARLAQIRSVDDLDGFTCVELDTMATIDFQIIAGRGGAIWAEGEPIQFDPDCGTAIFKVNEKALEYILRHASKADEAQRADLSRLADFVREHSASHIYELATF